MNDLLNGWLSITSDILDTCLGYFTTIQTFNVAVLILGFVLAAFYLLLCIPPYTWLIKEEASQVMPLSFFNFLWFDVCAEHIEIVGRIAFTV